MYSKKPVVPAHANAATDLKAQLVADQGGEAEISAAKMALIDLIVMATLKHRIVTGYLTTIERPWCDRRSNRVWPVVMDATRLEKHLADLLGQLGLERIPAPVMDIRQMAGLED
jgi:hypothetical protein